MSATNRTDNGFGKARVRNLLIAILVPIALVAMYFAALGGAQERSGTLPALIVNNDAMATQANMDGTETDVVAGRLLVSWLTNTQNVDQFDWRLVNEETAAEELAAGNAYVAVTIPEDFSAAIVSLSGGDPRSARIDITTDQAHDWLTGAVSQELFDGLIAEFGQSVTNMVALGLADGMNESAEGLQEAADGAAQLADGIGQLDNGFGEFLDGSGQLADGTGEASDGAREFADGVGTFASGTQEYVSGVETYVGGVNQFAGGISGYTSGVQTYVDGVSDFAGGVQGLAAGLEQLDGGSADLQAAASELGGLAGELEAYGPQIAEAAEQLEQLLPLLSDVAEFDPAGLYSYCDQLEALDPAMAAECRTGVDELLAAIDTSGIDIGGIESGLAGAIEQLQGIGSAGEGLGQLADGIVQYTDGVSEINDGAQQLASGAGALVDGGDELSSGSGQLDAGASQLIDGGEQLVAGGPQLSDGAGQLSDGASGLADGLSELAAGQRELAEGGEELGAGIGELGDGASTMAQGLQDGADQAANAIGDPESFADVVAQPVVAETTAVNDPTFGGVLGSVGLAVGIWLAALITALRRRIVTPDILESSASNAAIIVAAMRRITGPVAVVALVLAVIPHLFLGAPWTGFFGSLLFAVLGTLAVAAIHLLLATVVGRRSGAVISLALLMLQLVLIRAYIPLEFKAAWLEQFVGFFPLPQIAAGLQALYAGGSVATVFGAGAALALIAIFASGVAAIALARSRRHAGEALISLGSEAVPNRS